MVDPGSRGNFHQQVGNATLTGSVALWSDMTHQAPIRQHQEAEADRQHRLAFEADARDPGGAERRRRLTLEGMADVDADRLIDDEAMKVWVDSLGTDDELPAPQPG